MTSLTVNDKQVEVDAPAGTMLLEVLREHLDLRGARGTCGVGLCGTCTVLLDGEPISSCILPWRLAEDRTITTIEGLPEDDEVRRAFEEAHAYQCGFCIPGMILTAVAYLAEDPSPTRTTIAEALGGNLCRCGSYVKIIDAIEEAAR